MLGSRLTLPQQAVAFAFAACASLLATTAGAQTPSLPQLSVDLDLPSYQAELDRCAGSVKNPAEASRLRQSLPRTWLVHMGDSRIPVSTEWLNAKLQDIERDPTKSVAVTKDIEEHLAALRKAAAEMESGAKAPPSPLDARKHLEKILQRREFAGVQGPSPVEVLKERIGRWISEQIYKLLSRLHISANAGNIFAWTVVSMAFLLLCYWAWKNLPRGSRVRLAGTDELVESSDSRLWAKEALTAAERGDYREAIHCAYWAAVVHLEGLGMLKRDRARTPRESLRLLDTHPAEQKLLREFTGTFELIWYGYRTASAQDWTDARARLERMGCLTPSTVATANS
jgi:hypothetical protein